VIEGCSKPYRRYREWSLPKGNLRKDRIFSEKAGCSVSLYWRHCVFLLWGATVYTGVGTILCMLLDDGPVDMGYLMKQVNNLGLTGIFEEIQQSLSD